MGIIVSSWTVLTANCLAGVVVFVAVLARGRLSNSFALPACFILGIAAAALDYMQNGQLVGRGFGTIVDVFIRARDHFSHLHRGRNVGRRRARDWHSKIERQISR